MGEIAIGTYRGDGTLIHKIADELEQLKDQGQSIPYSFYQEESLKHLIKLNIGQEKSNLSSIIARTIIEDETKNIVNRAIRDEYYYLTREEKTNLYRHIMKRLNEESQLKWINYYYDLIESRLNKDLEENEVLLLDGFINFRLKDYVESIGEQVDLAAEYLLDEKEYMEFVRVLKYFVNIQDPKVDELNLILEGKDGYQLLDKKGEPLSNEYLDLFEEELVIDEVNSEDMLMSTLITLAPRKIVLHFKKEKPEQVVRTLEEVFGDRMSICTGCNLCQQV